MHTEHTQKHPCLSGIRTHDLSVGAGEDSSCLRPRGAVGILQADHVAPSIPKKLALTSLTSGGRSFGIVRLRTEAMEFF
jgi:hypothetical protein